MILYSIIFLVLTISVSSKEVQDGNVSGERYNFNHPPSAADDSPITVAIIYDDNNQVTEKSEDITTDDTSSDRVLKNKLANESETSESSPLSETTTTLAKSGDNRASLSKPRERARYFGESQIPVQVVYEDLTTIKSNIRTKTEAVTESPKRGRSRRRKNKIISVDSEKSKILSQNKATERAAIEKKSVDKPVTEKRVVTEKPVTNTAPRTFPKRVGGRDPIVPIIDSESYVFSNSGNFHYRYQGGDGTMAFSEGKRTKGDKSTSDAVRGGFSYTDKEGNDFSLSYTADENGYRPVGAHLPTPPPIPPAIARALAYLATATPEPVTKRSTKV